MKKEALFTTVMASMVTTMILTMWASLSNLS